MQNSPFHYYAARRISVQSIADLISKCNEAKKRGQTEMQITQQVQEGKCIKEFPNRDMKKRLKMVPKRTQSARTTIPIPLQQIGKQCKKETAGNWLTFSQLNWRDAAVKSEVACSLELEAQRWGERQLPDLHLRPGRIERQILNQAEDCAIGPRPSSSSDRKPNPCSTMTSYDMGLTLWHERCLVPS